MRPSTHFARLGRLDQVSILLNLCSHRPTTSFGLAREKTVLEIAIAASSGAA